MSGGPRPGRVIVGGVAPAVLILLLGPLARAANDAASHDSDHGLGVVALRVSCSAPAQVQFNRALALLHHMTYPEARAAFREVATIDPQCAMAYWGIAMTLFQPLWPTRPGPQGLQQG